MAYWEQVEVPPSFTGVTRAERQGGRYHRYRPDLLTDTVNTLSPEVLEYAAAVSTVLTRLGDRLRANPLPILYSTMIRSESISSSWIEGIRETPRAVALAQIGDQLASHDASQIVRNVTAMREAIDLLGRGAWTHEQIWQIQHDLLPWHTEGYRSAQVWIGGTNPLNADYAAPPGDAVPALMDDLLGYANSSGDLPIVTAAIVHAQFETVHPFEDGNGRVGRALVHGVLKRAGLVDGGVIPLSTALRGDVRGYVEALTAYRYEGEPATAREPALNAYVSQFLGYTEIATAAAEHFVDAATAIHQRWRHAVAGVRSDSAVHRAVDLVVEHPVVSAKFVADSLHISSVSAHKIIKQLIEVNILKPATGKYRKSALFQADEVLTLLAFGSEAGPRNTLPAPPEETAALQIVHRCGFPLNGGPCQNRVPADGQRCWRHRTG